MECFYEQFQTKDYGSLEKVLNILSKLALGIAILFVAMFSFVKAAVFAFIFLIIFILTRRIIVEYEYELTADELVVFKIMNKSKRKIIGSFNVRDIVSIKNSQNMDKSNNKVIKAYLKGIGLKDKIFMVKAPQGVIGFQLAMDEKLIDLIKRMNPIAFY